MLDDSLASQTTYNLNDTVTIRVKFNEPVTYSTSSGDIYLNLTVGTDTTITAPLDSTKTLKEIHEFTYTVGSGHNDTDGIEVTGLSLIGHVWIDDAYNNDVDLSTFPPTHFRGMFWWILLKRSKHARLL